MTQVVKHAAATDRMGSEPEFAEYMNETISSGLTTDMAQTISFDDMVSSSSALLGTLRIVINRIACSSLILFFQYLNAAASLLEAFVELFLVELKNNRFNESYIMAMTWAFSPIKNMHKSAF